MQRVSKTGIAQEVVIHSATLDCRPFSCKRSEMVQAGWGRHGVTFIESKGMAQLFLKKESNGVRPRLQ